MALGFATSLIVVIIEVALSWNRISTLNYQLTGTMGEAYMSSAAFVFCGVLEVASLCLAIVYFFQEKSFPTYWPVKPAIIQSLIGIAVVLGGAPLLLNFVENILLIIAVIVVVIILFLLFLGSGSSEGSSDGSSGSTKDEAPVSSASSGTKGSMKKGPQPRIKRIDRACKVFRRTTSSGYKCITTTNGIASSNVCSQKEYDTGKVRILVDGTKDEDHVILPGPPAGWKG